MPLKPIDMLINFLQMNNAVNEVEKGKENVLSQQVASGIRVKKEIETQATILDEKDHLEINAIDFDPNDPHSQEQQFQQDDSSAQDKKDIAPHPLPLKTQEEEKGNIIDIRE